MNARRRGTDPPALVIIGASAGGPAALALILKGLPRDFKPAIVIAQHADDRFIDDLVTWLQTQCALPVRLAREGDRPVGGEILVAATGGLLTMKEGLLHYAPVGKSLYTPSIDTLFLSIAAEWSHPCLAVLLTGMGSDGARGLKALRDRGFPTVAQDQASSAVFGMPRAAARLEAAGKILSLEAIVALIPTHQPQKPPPSKGRVSLAAQRQGEPND